MGMMSPILLRIFFLVLITLPMTAWGEFVFSLGGWMAIGGTGAHMEGTKSLYSEPCPVEGSADGSVQNIGAAGGIAYWFARVPVLGVGLDYFSSSATFGDARMTLSALSSCLLIRVPLGKSSAFENGRIFPYVGLGLAVELLEGPSAVFPGDEEEQLDSVGFLGKVGLEYVIVGGLSVFVEGRYMTCEFTHDSVDDVYYGWYWFIPVELGRDTTHLAAKLSHGQISIGMALHLGK